MKKYSIWLVEKEGYIHTEGLRNNVIALESAFRELGYDVLVSRQPDMERCNVVIGGHLLETIPKVECIIYNLEQVGSAWFTEVYIELLRRHKVWDYSPRNIEGLRILGIEAQLLPMGYAKELTIIPEAEHSTDVLFYGSLNQRRTDVLEELARKCKVSVAINCYGEKRDEIISKSKIILNMHYHPQKIFEMGRCSYLLANRKCVVSEMGEDYALEAPMKDALHFCMYENLVKDTLELLADEKRRRNYELRGFEIFYNMRQADYLKAVL